MSQPQKFGRGPHQHHHSKVLSKSSDGFTSRIYFIEVKMLTDDNGRQTKHGGFTYAKTHYRG